MSERVVPAVADLCIHVGNFLGLGEEYETTPKRKTLTLIRVRLGGRQLEIRQDPNFVMGSRQNYRGFFVPATQIIVRRTEPKDEKVVLRLVEDVCWLLSLASMSQVVPYQVDSPPGHMLHCWSVVGAVGKSWTLVDIRHGKQVRQFLEQSFPVFRRMKGKRRFVACIHVLLHAEAGSLPMELSMVTVYVALEMLKDTWARERRIRYAGGKFWKIGLKERPEPYSFQALLREMCAEVHMRPSLKRLVDYRNALIHSGGLRFGKIGKRRAYNSAQRLAREYMLRRLGYRGPYVVFGAMKMKLLR